MRQILKKMDVIKMNNNFYNFFVEAKNTKVERNALSKNASRKKYDTGIPLHAGIYSYSTKLQEELKQDIDMLVKKLAHKIASFSKVNSLNGSIGISITSLKVKDGSGSFDVDILIPVGSREEIIFNSKLVSSLISDGCIATTRDQSPSHSRADELKHKITKRIIDLMKQKLSTSPSDFIRRETSKTITLDISTVQANKFFYDDEVGKLLIGSSIDGSAPATETNTDIQAIGQVYREAFNRVKESIGAANEEITSPQEHRFQFNLDWRESTNEIVFNISIPTANKINVRPAPKNCPVFWFDSALFKNAPVTTIEEFNSRYRNVLRLSAKSTEFDGVSLTLRCNAVPVLTSPEILDFVQGGYDTAKSDAEQIVSDEEARNKFIRANDSNKMLRANLSSTMAQGKNALGVASNKRIAHTESDRAKIINRYYAYHPDEVPEKSTRSDVSGSNVGSEAGVHVPVRKIESYAEPHIKTPDEYRAAFGVDKLITFIGYIRNQFSEKNPKNRAYRDKQIDQWLGGENVVAPTTEKLKKIQTKIEKASEPPEEAKASAKDVPLSSLTGRRKIT